MVHIYNGILLSHEKEQIWVSFSEVNEPRASYTEWNKSEKEKQVSHINAHIWNLEKLYGWTCSQGRNGDADAESGLMDTAGGGEGRTNWESSTDIHTLSCVRYILVGSCRVTQGAQPIYTELIHVVTRQKPTHCKAIILQ